MIPFSDMWLTDVFFQFVAFRLLNIHEAKAFNYDEVQFIFSYVLGIIYKKLLLNSRSQRFTFMSSKSCIDLGFKM